MKSTFVVFILFFVTSVYSQAVGDACQQDDGTSGSCIFLGNCPSAIAALQSRRELPKTCFYDGTAPIICCSGNSPAPTVPTPPPTAPPPPATPQPPPPTPTRAPPSRNCPPISANYKRPQPRTDNEPGAKAHNECIKYLDSVVRCLPPFIPNGPWSRKDYCKHNSQELIYGGTAAHPNEFPHMALLGFQGDLPDSPVTWECGGTLISDRYVITAGHCVFNRESGNDVKFIRLGSPRVNDPLNPQLTFNVKTHITHPDYTISSIYNDIALLEMDRTVRLSDTVLPACLHVGNKVKDNKMMASGWGNTEGGSRSQGLLKVTIEKFTFEECSPKYTPKRRSKDGVRNATQLCAGSHTEVKDACQGDSGGPLQIYSPDVYCMYTLMGVTSIGKSCGSVGVPGLYTRVSAYIPWIESVVWP